MTSCVRWILVCLAVVAWLAGPAGAEQVIGRASPDTVTPIASLDARSEDSRQVETHEPDGEHGADAEKNGHGHAHSNEALVVAAASAVAGLGVAAIVGQQVGAAVGMSVVGLWLLHLPVHMVIWGGGGLVAWESAKSVYNWTIGYSAE
jgi:hypothetical protein